MNENLLAFGPVPSRRLGYSLGINHIPPKHCPYSCVYCQVGRTTSLEVTPREFYPVDAIVQAVESKVSDSIRTGRKIDYLTLVPDGEPTLDSRIGELIGALKVFQIPIAVISNAALIDRADVQDGLMEADWVSMKVDSVTEMEWRKINRPHGSLSLAKILNGILEFRGRFTGELVTETMLVAGINDHEQAARSLSDFLLTLQPFKSYLSIPTRPPAEAWVKVPDPESLQRVLQILSGTVPFIDLLFETETGDFATTGNLVEDILSITAVHPIREEALRQMVAQSGEQWDVVEGLLTSGKISCIRYRDEQFYLRRFQSPASR